MFGNSDDHYIEQRDTMARDDVKLIVGRALVLCDASSGSGDRIELDYSPSEQRANECGVDRITVVVDSDGDVVTPFPKEGDFVGWNGQEFLISDGDGGRVPVNHITAPIDTDMMINHA